MLTVYEADSYSLLGPAAHSFSATSCMKSQAGGERLDPCLDLSTACACYIQIGGNVSLHVFIQIKYSQNICALSVTAFFISCSFTKVWKKSPQTSTKPLQRRSCGVNVLIKRTTMTNQHIYFLFQELLLSKFSKFSNIKSVDVILFVLHFVKAFHYCADDFAIATTRVEVFKLPPHKLK